MTMSTRTRLASVLYAPLPRAGLGAVEASAAPSGPAGERGRAHWVGAWTAGPQGSGPGRLALNRWIRAGGRFDAVIDFDAVARDPANPAFPLPAYDSGDHVHFNVTGYRALANSIDLSLFRARSGVNTPG